RHVTHVHAKDTAVPPGAAVRGVLDTDFGPVPEDPARRTPTGIGHSCSTWPEDPAWRFVALGEGHDVEYWTGFLTALAATDPDLNVNIEHEDAAFGQVEGLERSARTLLARSEERRVGKEATSRSTLRQSSRRRHTRSKRDWSSDVCSSDLLAGGPGLALRGARRGARRGVLDRFPHGARCDGPGPERQHRARGRRLRPGRGPRTQRPHPARRRRRRGHLTSVDGASPRPIPTT